MEHTMLYYLDTVRSRATSSLTHNPFLHCFTIPHYSNIIPAGGVR